MGCCWCNLKTSASFAGYFAVIQSTTGFYFAAYHLGILYVSPQWRSPDIDNLREATDSHRRFLKAMLSVALVLYAVWLVSSIVMLYGNIMCRAKFVHQWLLTTPIIIIACDFFLTISFLILTLKPVLDFGHKLENKPKFNLYDSYLMYFLTFSRGAIITIVSNIALLFYTYQRWKIILACPVVTPPPRKPHRPYRIASAKPTKNTIRSIPERRDLYIHGNSLECSNS